MVDVLHKWAHLLGTLIHSRFSRSASAARDDLGEVAALSQLLAMLLVAGLSPHQALMHARVEREEFFANKPPTPLAFLADVWRLGIDLGAPLKDILVSLSHALAHASRNSREARSQLAGPQAATKLVMILPGIAIVGGMAAGYNPLAFILFQPVGWFLFVVAVGLMWLAHTWSASLVATAEHTTWANGMPTEVMAMALRSGASLRHARQCAQEIANDYLTDHVELEQCDEFMELSTRTGVALSDLLHAHAELLRDRARSTSHEAIERLGVKLMIPLGVCVLPAFIAVGVLPLVASVISSTTLY